MQAGFNGNSSSGGHVINAFIGEQPIPLDMEAVRELLPRLRDWNGQSVARDSSMQALRKVSLHMAKRLDLLVPTVTELPPIPSVVTGGCSW